MKKAYTLFSLIFLIVMAQIYTFGGKTFFENKASGNPYIKSDGNSFRIIPNSTTLNSSVFELIVYDNDENDFYNYFTGVSYAEVILISMTSDALLLLNQSDIENNNYRFLINESWTNGNSDVYSRLYKFNLALDYPSSDVRDNIYFDPESVSSLNISDEDRTIYKPVTYSGFPTILTFINDDIASNEAFSIDEVTGDSVTFTFESYGENQIFPNSFEVIMKDNNISDPMFDTLPYTATLINESTTPPSGETGNYLGNFYTYQITELQPSSYTFISFANSGMSKGSTSTSTFNPDNDINLVSELNYDPVELTFEMIESPSIISTSFQIIDLSATISSIQFSMQITDNATNDFYNNLIANSNQIAITLIDVTNGNQSLNTTATWTGVAQPTDGIYTFQINDLYEDNNYQIYSLNNTGLTIDDAYSPVDNEIIISDDLGVTDNNFTTLSDNPYIQTDSFEITNVTDTFVEFQITVINDIEGSFIPENNINVTLSDINTTHHQTVGIYQSSIDNTYTYRISELETGVPFTIGNEYEIYSLNNTGLAIGNSTSLIDDEILIASDLGEDGHFSILYNNPYIQSGSFEVVETTKISVQFQIKVTNDTDNNFVPQNDLNVTLKDSQSVSHQTTAHYVRTDTVDPNIYVYEITELESGVTITPGENYSIYSLNNTGLAIDDSTGEIDSEIIIVDDLGGDGNFTTTGNPYIESGSFMVISSTKTSMQFQITIKNNSMNEFIPENNLEITLLDEAQISHQTTAHYVSTVGDIYTYEITEESSGVMLNPGTDYQIVSLNNTGLAIGEDSNVIDDEILIVDDLGGDGNFTTTGNPYIISNSFMITSTTKSSVQFKFTVSNNSLNEFVPGSSLAVKIKTDDQIIHDTTANYIAPDGSDPNTYIYEITEESTGIPLNPGTNYQIVSLLNTGLAVGQDSSLIDDEILITDELGGDGSFTTIGNPYVEDSSFFITSITTTSIEFKLKVTDNELDEFNPTDSINVTIKDSSGISHSSTANYLRTDPTDPNIFYYEVVELETGIPFISGESYNLYSLNNTGLSTAEDSNIADDEILIVDDLHADGNFIISSNSFIYNQGFMILSSSQNSVKFQLKIEDVASTFNSKNPLNVTLKDVDNNTTFSTDATLVTEETSDNNYVYEITNLDSEKNYEFVSLNDVNLAIGGSGAIIHEDLILMDDLGISESDLTFDTITNPYIPSENGFKIIDDSKTINSIQYSLLAYNWSDHYVENMEVKMLNYSTGQEEIHNASFVEKKGNNYTYEINDLATNTSYKFISISNTNLAVGSQNAPINDEINLETDLGISSDEITFATSESFFDRFFLVIMILGIIDFTLIILIFFVTKEGVKKEKIRDAKKRELLNTDISNENE